MAETSFAVPLANMKISAVDGTAFLDCGALGAALLTHMGEKVTVTDSAGKSIVGYIKAAGSGVMPSDLLNEDCSDISDWTDGDTDTAVSEVDPAGQFRFDTNAGADGNAWAQMSKTLSQPPNQFTLELVTYFDSIGTHADSNYFRVSYGTGTWFLRIHFCSNGLFVYRDGGVIGEVGAGIVKCNASAAVQTWRFEVDKRGGEAAATVEVFLDGISQGTVDCDYVTAGTAGLFFLRQYGYTDNDMVSHVDSIKVAAGVLPATTGVTIVSASGGTTYNWATKDAAFNYADASGYTVTIKISGIEVIMYRVLAADGSIGRRINTRIFPVVMPQNVILPAVSYQRISADPMNTLAGASGLVNAHIVINSWARTYDDAKALAMEVKTAMNGAAAFKSLLVNELDGYDPDVSLYVVSQDFSCWGEE